MSFIGAAYAANCKNLPPLLVKSLTDSGTNGAQYVLVVNKYDAQAGYYADIWAFDGKELKHANHIKDVDVAKILGAGAALNEGKITLKDLTKFENPLKQEKAAEYKQTKSNRNDEKSDKQIKGKTNKSESTNTTKQSSKKNDVSLTKKAAKKELATAKENYKKTGAAIDKAKTKKTKQEAQAAHARAGKALIKAENAVK